VDQSGDPSVTYTYRVTANNSAGASLRDQCPSRGAHRQLLHGNGTKDTDEPPRAIKWARRQIPIWTFNRSQWRSHTLPTARGKLVFRLKVASLAPPGPNHMWRLIWNYPDAPVPPESNRFPASPARYYLGI